MTATCRYQVPYAITTLYGTRWYLVPGSTSNKENEIFILVGTMTRRKSKWRGM